MSFLIKTQKVPPSKTERRLLEVSISFVDRVSKSPLDWVGTTEYVRVVSQQHLHVLLATRRRCNLV